MTMQNYEATIAIALIEGGAISAALLPTYAHPKLPTAFDQHVRTSITTGHATNRAALRAGVHDH